MKILVCLFVISNISLVFSNDNAAIENNVTHQTTYKVHPDPEENDQVAESSHSVSEIYQNRGEKVPETSQTQIQIAVHNGQNVQQETHSPENLRHNDVVNNQEMLQPALSQYNPTQQIYLQQYPLQPIRIFGAEASPYHQIHENEPQKPLGYSSYVEHVSEKDEINSALKEGSMGDIKRLVPKSGISFKIYHNEKNVNVEDQKTETQSNVVTHVHTKTPQIPRQKFRLKPQVPPKVQTAYKEHHQSGIETSTKAGEQQHEYENFQHLLQSAGGASHTHDHNQNLYYVQPEVTQLPQTNHKVYPHIKLNGEGNGYKKATSTAEFNSLTANVDLKHANNLQYNKQWSLHGKVEESQKGLVKPVLEEQYEIDPVAQAERARGHLYSQTHALQNNLNKFKTHESFTETGKSIPIDHQTNSFASQSHFTGHLANKIHPENKLINRLTGNYLQSENVKTGQNHLISLGTSLQGDSQIYKTGQSEQFATKSIYDSETAKTSQHNLVSHVAKTSYVEAKSGQNGFDHQKALEGSTSFDIKNAIDNAGNLIHQPTTDAHHTEELQKQQLAYVLPKIPTSTVLLDNSVHETPILGGHQFKDFGISSSQLPYHSFSTPEINGKFFQQPTILLASEHLKQGNSLTVNDLHQPLIKLHLPKEEIYQQVKPHNLEFPTSSVSHISFHQPKQQYVLHYDVPSVKYPQEFVLHPKTKPRVQNTQTAHIKVSQPSTFDWSWFKSYLPSFNFNSLGGKSEILTTQESGKKIVPILIRKRKNRSNNKQEVGVIYGKVNNNRRPTKPNHRNEKTVRTNLYSEASNNVNQYEPKGERKNEFSVSASYKVDRSFKTPNHS